jgi:hypothetical protein
VALAVGTFADGPPDRKAVAAGAGGGGEHAAPSQLRLQPPGRGRAADDLLEPAIGKQIFEAIILVLVEVARASAVVVSGGVFYSPSPAPCCIDTLSGASGKLNKLFRARGVGAGAGFTRDLGHDHSGARTER